MSFQLGEIFDEKEVLSPLDFLDGTKIIWEDEIALERLDLKPLKIKTEAVPFPLRSCVRNLIKPKLNSS